MLTFTEKLGLTQSFKDRIEVQILEKMKNLLTPGNPENFTLSPEDIIDMTSGMINKLIPALNKLIELLSIKPFDPEKIRTDH